MGINRPTNLNIRDVPGNGSIVGPSTSPTCIEPTTVCESCFNTCSSCSISFDSTVLGCTNTFCACPCCDHVCRCDCIVCDRKIPSGMWKISEQYEAKGRDAWGDDTSRNDPAVCICNINFGYTCKGPCNVPTGGYVICASGGVGWIVAPAGTEVSRAWYDRDQVLTTANACAACGDWFVPSCGQLQNPGYVCRSYWDSYSTVYRANNVYRSNDPWKVDFTNGSASATYDGGYGASYPFRAFRCVTY